jgi:phage gp36-like protein
MAYSTLGKLRSALAPGTFTDPQSGPPTTLTDTAADLPDDQLQDALDEASSIVDAALSSRYTVPVAGSPTPHPIDYWARAIAAYLATCTYRGSLDFSNEDPVYRRYLVATGALDSVAKGTYTLSIPSNVGANAPAGGGAGAPINPYSGNLFGAEDFNLEPQAANFGYGQNRWWQGAWFGNDG